MRYTYLQAQTQRLKKLLDIQIKAAHIVGRLFV
jgi:hypothetical protein